MARGYENVPGAPARPPKGAKPRRKRRRPRSGAVDMPLRVRPTLRVLVSARWAFDSARSPTLYPPCVKLGPVTHEEAGSTTLVLHDAHGNPLARYALVRDPGPSIKSLERAAFQLLREL